MTEYDNGICVAEGGLGANKCHSVCGVGCFHMSCTRNTIPNGNDLIHNSVYDGLNVSLLEKCQTFSLQYMLKYEEKRIERIMKVVDKIKDTLKSRYGLDIPFTSDTTPHSNNYLENYICEKEKLIEPFFKYSTDCLKIVLNYEEKHIEKIKEVLNKTKDVLKSREG